MQAIRRLALFLTLLWVSIAGFAQELTNIVDVGSGRAPEIRISRKDFTRIAVFDGRIVNAKFKKGDLDTSPDEKTGSLYVLPNVSGPVSTFIITQSGQTHQVNLVPSDQPAQTIVLREPAIDKASKDTKSSINDPRSVSQRVDRATSFDAAIKRLVGAMARNEKPADLTYREVNQEFQLWQCTRLWLMSQYTGQTYSGEHFRLQNTCPQPLRLDEREFFKPGVLAVSMEIHQLAPQESTDIFIAREARNGK